MANRITLVFLAGLIAFAAQSGTAGAAEIIYDNNVTTVDGLQSDAESQRFVADNFVLAPGMSTVTDVHWTGLYGNDNTPGIDNFTIQFFANANGIPAISPFASFAVGNAVNRVDTGTDHLIFDIYSYSADIAPLLLAPATMFWISIFNNTSSDSNDNWFWGAGKCCTGEDAAIRDGTTGSWARVMESLNFQLTGPVANVAEPGSLALISLALAGLGFSRRKFAS